MSHLTRNVAEGAKKEPSLPMAEACAATGSESRPVDNLLIVSHEAPKKSSAVSIIVCPSVCRNRPSQWSPFHIPHIVPQVGLGTISDLMSCVGDNG